MARRKFAMFSLFRAFSFDMILFYSIQLLFLSQVRGFPASQVIALEGIFWALQIVFQLPSALIVERIGYKSCTCIGSALWILAISLYLIPGPAFLIYLAEVLRAAGLVLNGIADTPLVYESTKDNYAQVEGMGVFLYFMIDSIMAASAGFLFKANPYFPMEFCLVICIISLTTSLMVQDVPITKRKDKSNIADYKEIFKSRFVRSLLIYAFCMCGILSLPSTLNKAYMQEILVPVELFGIILGFLGAINAVSATIVKKIMDLFKARTMEVISLSAITVYGILGLSCIFFKGTSIIYLVIIPLFIVQNSSKQPYRIIMKQYINENVPKKLVPKTLSIYFIAESIGRSALLLFSGVLTDNFTVGTTYLLLCTVVIIPVIVATITLQKQLNR